MSGENDGADGAKGPESAGVIQSPAVAQAQADQQAAALASYLVTAREWYANGSPLDKCAEWLLAQGDPKYSTLEDAAAAISQ